MGMFSSLANLPIWVKIILGLLLLGVLLFAGIVTLIKASTYTDETVLIERNCGASRLKISVLEKHNVGNTSTDYRLYWNDKIVADKGDMGASGYYNSVPPIDPDDQENLTIILLADTVDATAWTVWVNPTQFSRADFDAITACLRAYNAENPRPSLDGNTVTTTTAFTNFAHVGQLVYGDLQSLKPRVYRRKFKWEEKGTELTVHPGGYVDLRRDYIVETVGQVTMMGNRRVLTWSYAEESPLQGSDLAGFKNDAGQLLTNRYELRHSLQDNQLFFRKTAKSLDWVFIRRQPYIGTEGNTVSGHTIDLSAPILRRSYDAGTIKTDSLNPSQPVFYWQTWPDHPLTEADLREFRNEQGQTLGQLYWFDYQPPPNP